MCSIDKNQNVGFYHFWQYDHDLTTNCYFAQEKHFYLKL
jgi:hypothetical protein